MNVFEARLKVYATSQEEVSEMENAIMSFIRLQANEGRAVTANKITAAVNGWQSNIFVKNKINKHFES